MPEGTEAYDYRVWHGETAQIFHRGHCHQSGEAHKRCEMEVNQHRKGRARLVNTIYILTAIS